MNQKFSWVAWRGAQTLSQITPKIFGSGPFLILQATRKFFPTHFQHVPKGLPHIAIFALTSSYAPKTSNFMIGMLFCWVRINFGWKLSRQFLGIFFNEFCPILWELLDLSWCLGTQNLCFLKLYKTHNTKFLLRTVKGGKIPQKGDPRSSKCLCPASNHCIFHFMFFVIFCLFLYLNFT